MHKMDDLWPGVAAVCLCPVCVTSAMGFGRGGGTLLMFPLRHDEGKGTVEALLMLQRDGQITDRRRCTLQEQAPRVNTEIMMTRPPSPCCSLHLSQSPECKAASSDQLFFFCTCKCRNFCAIVQSFGLRATVFSFSFSVIHLLSELLDKRAHAIKWIFVTLVA